MSGKLILKICDFGVALECKAGTHIKSGNNRPGKFRYMAPEVCVRVCALCVCVRCVCIVSVLIFCVCVNICVCVHVCFVKFV